MTRPTNAESGRPSRTRRVTLQFTDAEYAEVADAAARLGLGVGPFIRAKALEAVREED